MELVQQIHNSSDRETILNEMEKNFEFNIVLLGDPNVGKSSLVFKLVNM